MTAIEKIDELLAETKGWIAAHINAPEDREIEIALAAFRQASLRSLRRALEKKTEAARLEFLKKLRDDNLYAAKLLRFDRDRLRADGSKSGGTRHIRTIQTAGLAHWTALLNTIITAAEAQIWVAMLKD
jgi:hypothetical protein